MTRSDLLQWSSLMDRTSRRANVLKTGPMRTPVSGCCYKSVEAAVSCWTTDTGTTARTRTETTRPRWRHCYRISTTQYYLTEVDTTPMACSNASGISYNRRHRAPG